MRNGLAFILISTLLLATACGPGGTSSGGSARSGGQAQDGPAAAPAPGARAGPAPDSAARPGAQLEQVPAGSALKALMKALPTVAASPEGAFLRPAGNQEALLSPDGRYLAFSFQAAEGGASGIGLVPLLPEPGQPALLTWNPRQTKAETDPCLRLAGWLDEARLVIVRCQVNPQEPGDSNKNGEARFEIWEAGSAQMARVGGWIKVGGVDGARQARLWMTADKKALFVLPATGTLWRMELSDGNMARAVEQVPSERHVGPAAHPSPTGWLAVAGGESSSQPYRVYDLRTGTERPLPPQWRRVRWGAGDQVVALANTPERPGKDLPGSEATWSFYSTAVVAGPDLQVKRQIPVPEGYLIADAYVAPSGNQIILETAKLVPDPAEKEFGHRITPGPLYVDDLNGNPPRAIWQPDGKFGFGGPGSWILAGDWLLAGGKQYPLKGGEPLPMGQAQLLAFGKAALAGPWALTVFHDDGATRFDLIKRTSTGP